MTISRERELLQTNTGLWTRWNPSLLVLYHLSNLQLQWRTWFQGVRTLQKGEKVWFRKLGFVLCAKRRNCLNIPGFVRNLLTAAQLPVQTDNLMLDVLFKILVKKIHHSKPAQGLVPTAVLSVHHALFSILIHIHSLMVGVKGALILL